MKLKRVRKNSTLIRRTIYKYHYVLHSAKNQKLFQNESGIERGVEDLKEFYHTLRLDLELKPLVVVCGQLENISGVFVIFRHHRYKCENILHAFQLAFKIFKVFGLSYPGLSKNAWSFIQRRPYQINLERNISCVDSLITKLTNLAKPKTSKKKRIAEPSET